MKNTLDITVKIPVTPEAKLAQRTLIADLELALKMALADWNKTTDKSTGDVHQALARVNCTRARIDMFHQRSAATIAAIRRNETKAELKRGDLA